MSAYTRPPIFSSGSTGRMNLNQRLKVAEISEAHFLDGR